MSLHDALSTLAILLAAGLAARFLADVLRLPSMLLLVVVGALLGPDLLGAVDVPLDSIAAELLLTVGVSFVLFYGGLQLSARVLSRTAIGLLLLVVPGVLLTAAVVGLVAAAAFDVPLRTGLLIGAVLAPTDPAILIPLFERLGLRPRLSETIVAESALNDPTGAVLALVLAAAVAGGDASVGGTAAAFLEDLGIATALGVGFGALLAVMVSSRRIGAWRESPAVAVVIVAVVGYVSIDFAGGSGYLGAFVAGLMVGNLDVLRLEIHPEEEAEVRGVAAVAADLVVVLVFTVLGANLPWGAIRDELWGALAVVATLVLVARPLAVAVCLLPDRRARWSAEELVFLAWTRETGVVPAALVGLLVAAEVPGAELAAASVAVAVLTTLGLQSTTKPWLARRLGLLGEH